MCMYNNNSNIMCTQQQPTLNSLVYQQSTEDNTIHYNNTIKHYNIYKILRIFLMLLCTVHIIHALHIVAVILVKYYF